ncbi:hypothetical protein STANM309S_03029 [Streptomyces tanashiensis]
MGVGEDPVVVEGEVPVRPVRDPPGLGRVAAAARFGRIGYERGEGDGDDPHPRVAVRFGVGTELFEVEAGDGGLGEPGLLGEFAAGGRFGGLAGQHESAGQGPRARVGLLAALDSRTWRRSSRRVRTARSTVTAKGAKAYGS